MSAAASSRHRGPGASHALWSSTLELFVLGALDFNPYHRRFWKRRAHRLKKSYPPGVFNKAGVRELTYVGFKCVALAGYEDWF